MRAFDEIARGIARSAVKAGCALVLACTILVSQSAIPAKAADALDSYPWRTKPAPLSCFGKCRDSSNAFVGCDDKRCYGRDEGYPLSFGLSPRRTYRLVYGEANPVCLQIRDALNWALAQKGEALAALWRENPEGLTTNPLFSSKIFVRWHRLTDWRGRWIVVPFMNDGVPRLIVMMGGIEPELWRYSPQEIAEGSWDKFARYDRSKLASNTQNPIDKIVHYRPPAAAAAPWQAAPWDAPANMRYPRLPKPLWESPIWKYSNRAHAGYAEFAVVDHRYYFVKDDNLTDTLFVADVSKEPGADICYLQSSFSRWLTDDAPRRGRQR